MNQPLQPFPSVVMLPLSLCLVGGLLFLALLHRQRELIILCLLLLAVAGGAKLWARLGAAGLACRMAVDPIRLFPGETVTLALEAENRRWLPVFLRVSVPVGGLSGTGQLPLAAERGLLWQQRVTFHWRLTAAHRGVHCLGPHRVTAGDLLGFFPAAARAGTALEVVVYPRLVPLHRLAVPRREFFGRPGGTSPVRDPVYILGTREYRHGGPAKHIHWKASARHHRLQEKVFEPSQQAKILLLVEVAGFAAAEASGEFERMLEAVASLAARLDREGSAVGLIASGAVVGGGTARVPIGRGPRQLPTILERLARLTPRSAAPLREMLGDGPLLPWGTSCLCFAREGGPGPLAAARHLADRRLPTILFLATPDPAGQGSETGGLDVRPLETLFLGGVAA